MNKQQGLYKIQNILSKNNMKNLGSKLMNNNFNKNYKIF